MTARKDDRTAQERIKAALNKSGYTETWLANKIGMKVNTLNSRLNSAKTFPHQLYEDIMEIFRKYDIVSSECEQCDMIVDRTLEWGSILGSSLSLLNKTIHDTIGDKILDFEDRKKLKGAIKNIREQLIDKLDEIERLIEG